MTSVIRSCFLTSRYQAHLLSELCFLSSLVCSRRVVAFFLVFLRDSCALCPKGRVFRVVLPIQHHELRRLALTQFMRWVFRDHRSVSSLPFLFDHRFLLRLTFSVRVTSSTNHRTLRSAARVMVTVRPSLIPLCSGCLSNFQFCSEVSRRRCSVSPKLERHSTSSQHTFLRLPDPPIWKLAGAATRWVRVPPRRAHQCNPKVLLRAQDHATRCCGVRV